MINKEPIDEALKKYDITDFLIKVKSSNLLHFSEIKDGLKISTMIQSPSRFYYCNNYKTSGSISKRGTHNFEIISECYPVAMLNNINDKKDDIDYRYYRREIFDIINAVKEPASSGLLFL